MRVDAAIRVEFQHKKHKEEHEKRKAVGKQNSVPNNIYAFCVLLCAFCVPIRLGQFSRRARLACGSLCGTLQDIRQ
ncbi:MAG TPA: hypothetical protein VFY40_25255, partial [Blastocatellia bacterium]|nr:hypothetical protein [Blastocatellia bacterium]